jgi:acyl-CoA thioester hydrolase
MEAPGKTMNEPFSKTLFVRWGDIDFNRHMRNTAYLDAAVDIRMMYFESAGFSVAELDRLGVGPVVMRDEVDYRGELKLLDPYRATLLLAGLSEDASRMRLRNEFYRDDGKLAARITTTGGWLNLFERKLIAPPEKLAQALRQLVRSDDYEELPKSAR